MFTSSRLWNSTERALISVWHVLCHGASRRAVKPPSLPHTTTPTPWNRWVLTLGRVAAVRDVNTSLHYCQFGLNRRVIADETSQMDKIWRQSPFTPVSFSSLLVRKTSIWQCISINPPVSAKVPFQTVILHTFFPPTPVTISTGCSVCLSDHQTCWLLVFFFVATSWI